MAETANSPKSVSPSKCRASTSTIFHGGASDRIVQPPVFDERLREKQSFNRLEGQYESRARQECGLRKRGHGLARAVAEAVFAIRRTLGVANAEISHEGGPGIHQRIYGGGEERN